MVLVDSLNGRVVSSDFTREAGAVLEVPRKAVEGLAKKMYGRAPKEAQLTSARADIVREFVRAIARGENPSDDELVEAAYRRAVPKRQRAFMA